MDGSVVVSFLMVDFEGCIDVVLVDIFVMDVFVVCFGSIEGCDDVNIMEKFFLFLILGFFILEVVLILFEVFGGSLSYEGCSYVDFEEKLEDEVVVVVLVFFLFVLVSF